MTEGKYDHNNDATFYHKIAYRNNKEYLENLLKMNITANEMTHKDILDYGCGAGDASFKFAEFSPSSITGIDIGERNIDIANIKKRELKLQNLQFIMADLNIYDIGSATFDLIWSDTVIELLRKPVETVIDDFSRALRPEGVLYISFTKRCLKIVILYTILRIINNRLFYRIRFIFYYLLLPRYYITKLFDKQFKIDHV